MCAKFVEVVHLCVEPRFEEAIPFVTVTGSGDEAFLLSVDVFHNRKILRFVYHVYDEGRTVDVVVHISLGGSGDVLRVSEEMRQ